MSVVIAMKHKNLVRMGADSAIVRGDIIETPSCRDAKIFLMPYDGPPESTNILIGVCGKVSIINCIKNSPKVKFPTPEEVEGGPVDGTYGVDLGFLVWWWVYHRLTPEFKRLGMISELKFEGEILVGIWNRLFEIDGSFSITEHDKFTAIGSGSHIALGAIQAMRLANFAHEHIENNARYTTTKSMILLALESTSKYHTQVNKPFLELHNGSEE